MTGWTGIYVDFDPRDEESDEECPSCLGEGYDDEHGRCETCSGKGWVWEPRILIDEDDLDDAFPPMPTEEPEQCLS